MKKKTKHTLHPVCLRRNTSSGKDLYLVQSDEGGNTDVLFFEEGNAFLSCVNGIHHDVVQGSTTRGNSYVILLIDGSEVSLQNNNSFEKNTFNTAFCSPGDQFGLKIKCFTSHQNNRLNCGAAACVLINPFFTSLPKMPGIPPTAF